MGEAGAWHREGETVAHCSAWLKRGESPGMSYDLDIIGAKISIKQMSDETASGINSQVR